MKEFLIETTTDRRTLQRLVAQPSHLLSIISSTCVTRVTYTHELARINTRNQRVVRFLIGLS